MPRFSPPVGTWQDDSLAEFFSLAPVFSAYRYLARGQPGGVFLTCFIFLRLQEHGKMTARRSFPHLLHFSPPVGTWQDDSPAEFFSLASFFSARRYMARAMASEFPLPSLSDATPLFKKPGFLGLWHQNSRANQLTAPARSSHVPGRCGQKGHNYSVPVINAQVFARS